MRWLLAALAVVLVTAGVVSSVGDAADTGQVVTVTRVVDGDTLDTTVGRVRVAVADSCEWGSPGGRAATADAHALLDGQTVRLVVVGDRDRERYGRLLRKVVLSDGRDFGAVMAARPHTGIYAGHIDAWPDYIAQVRAADIDGRVCG